MVLIAVPDFCLLTFPLGSKNLFLRTNSAICTISSEGISDVSYSLSLLLNVSKIFNYDQPSYTTRFKIWSKYSETFSVGVQQFDITGIPGTEIKCLCILGRTYINRLVAFVRL